MAPNEVIEIDPATPSEPVVISDDEVDLQMLIDTISPATLVGTDLDDDLKEIGKHEFSLDSSDTRFGQDTPHRDSSSLPSTEPQYVPDTANIHDEDIEGEPIPMPPHDKSFLLDETFHPVLTIAANEYTVPNQGNLRISAGADVALLNGMFLRINGIFQQFNTIGRSRYVFNGILLARNGADPSPLQDISCILPGHPNEVCWVVKVVEDSRRSVAEQSYFDVDASLFLHIVRVRFTNAMYPKGNSLCESGHDVYDASYHSGTTYPLACRWKVTMTWPDFATMVKRTATYLKRTFEILRPSECDDDYVYNPRETMNGFRGVQTPRGGEKQGICLKECERRAWELRKLVEADHCLPNGIPEGLFSMKPSPSSSHDLLSILASGAEQRAFKVDNVITLKDLDHPPDPYYFDTFDDAHGPHLQPSLQRYSFGDAYAGMGGTSRAAVLAGFHVKWAVELNEKACDSYMRNFPGTCLACTHVDSFIGNENYEKMVEILHMSCPCQPYSKAHTVEGQNDEENRRLVHTLQQLLEKGKPRVFTFENADGLYIQGKSLKYLRYVFAQLAALEYSVEARVASFSEYGLPQYRKRLFIIASCPGQRLPEFPKPTHGPPEVAARSRRLRPFNTYNVALAAVPDGWMDHAKELPTLTITDKAPYDGDKIGNTLTTKNTVAIPEGWRIMSTREKANIQAFPVYHQFGEGQSASDKAKQVGNAVPPEPFAVILRAIKHTLMEDDEMFEVIE